MFSDVCGPMENSTVEGYTSLPSLMIIANTLTLGFAKTKDNTLAAFKTWKACTEKETGKTLKILCTDGGGEYTSHTFSSVGAPTFHG